MGKKSGKEKRQYPRVRLPLSIEVYIGDGKETVWEGAVRDLSEGGLAFETERELKLHDKVILCFTLPKRKECDIIGEIVHKEKGSRGIAHGVKYYMVDVHNKSKLRKCILECQTAEKKKK